MTRLTQTLTNLQLFQVLISLSPITKKILPKSAMSQPSSIKFLMNSLHLLMS